MRLDQYSNPIFDENDLFEALYKGQTLSNDMFVEASPNVTLLQNQSGLNFLSTLDRDNISLNEYDQAMQADWNMPNNYKTLDIEAWLAEQSPPWDPNYTRLQEELEAYKARNMLDLLRWLKYFVDTCSKESILWGVGRGSSVASYVLYLIGVHSIDPIKYNLDWREFLR
jgi:DNA polymerase III alpha subunit